jgi:hypothetical protein
LNPRVRTGRPAVSENRARNKDDFGDIAPYDGHRE